MEVLIMLVTICVSLLMYNNLYSSWFNRTTLTEGEKLEFDLVNNFFTYVKSLNCSDELLIEMAKEANRLSEVGGQDLTQFVETNRVILEAVWKYSDLEHLLTEEVKYKFLVSLIEELQVRQSEVDRFVLSKINLIGSGK